MDVLMLCYRGEALREFPLGGRPLEVGQGAGCDIVVHDSSLRESHFLVVARGGTVVVHELDEARRGPSRTLPPGGALQVGAQHSLVRVSEVPTRPSIDVARTDPLPLGLAARGDLSLVIGRGADGRRVCLDARPVSIGTAAENAVVLGDRAISARHCRVEAGADGWQIRDLGSRNGTFVEGVRVSLARIDAGSTIRIGRTDLRLIARGESEVRDDDLIAESDEMQAVLEQVGRLAPLPYPTLITGESGSGKEGIARALHARGSSSRGPFVAVNAGGLPASLVESELFGHEKGAFTGAATARRGVFEQADGGTLFLDEIGELPLELQARLLRVLETWEIRRLGGERSIRVNVRLLCATHRDLKRMVANGIFREDLYYRVAQLAVHVPPLRDRPRDVEALADFFLAKERARVGARRFTEEARVRLLVHPWPGNARELRNVVVRVAARSAGAWIGAEEVAEVLSEMGSRARTSVGLERVLALYGGNVAAASRSLGIARTTFRDRLRKERGEG